MEVTIMKTSKTARWIWRLLFALVIIAGLTLGGLAIYKAGFTHGALSNLTLPEGSEYPPMPFGHLPYGRPITPRVGLLVLFPLLCFGGFFFLSLLFGFGLMARKRAWNHHYGPGPHAEYWKHHGPPPWWGQGKPPWAGDQPPSEPDAPPAETGETGS
jgi:hypothetical protein